jgi:MtfA peptidase
MPPDSSNIFMQLINQVQEGAGHAPAPGGLVQYTAELEPLAFPALLFVAVMVGIYRHSVRDYLRGRRAKRLFEEKEKSYHNILQQYIPYYRNLDALQKDRFLKRTLVFLSNKKFEFVEMEEEEHMSLLISATAVQLTFGLHNYLMDHFSTIYVMKADYRYGLFNVPFQGHVNDDGIYLSWNNFLRAYADYTDGDNVGLHEMAHALAYVNFTANNGVDEGFKSRFWKFSRVGRAVFKRLQDGEMTLLGTYAATNYQEFWAVCVENFFERPQPFKIQLPDLYDAMCNLLNQDMLTPGLLLRTVEEE